MENRKGMVSLPITIYIALGLMAIYLILFIPFVPQFKLIRYWIDLVMLFGLFIIVQLAIGYVYYYAITYAIKMYDLFVKYVLKFSLDLKKTIKH